MTESRTVETEIVHGRETIQEIRRIHDRQKELWASALREMPSQSDFTKMKTKVSKNNAFNNDIPSESLIFLEFVRW
jgi:hypothetical protein